MSTVAEKTLLTPEEFLALPDGVGFELIEGELKERNVSVLSSWIGGKIVRLLGNFAEDSQLGWVFPADTGCQCFAQLPNTVRKPDVTFVRADRLSAEQIGDGWLRLVPDLIVEVISPNDLWEELQAKLSLFRKAGVPLIWFVSPTARTVHVYRGDGSTALLHEDDELSGEGIIPGFACPVAAIFPPVIAEAAPNP